MKTVLKGGEVMPNLKIKFDPKRFAEAINEMGWDANEFRLQMWQRSGVEPSKNQVTAWLTGQYTPSNKFLPLFGMILNKPMEFFYTEC